MTAIVAPKYLSALIGSEVRVYRNLTRKCWSVQYRETFVRPDNGRRASRWRVAGHDQAVCLVDARFDVSRSGWERVRTTGRKDVHAFAYGTLGTSGQYVGVDNGLFFRLAGFCKKRIGYNPRQAEAPVFSLRSSGAPVTASGYAFFDGTGAVWIDGVRQTI